MPALPPGVAADPKLKDETAASDETLDHTVPEGGLLQPRDDAEAGYAPDLVSFSRDNRGPPKRAPEMRGSRGSERLGGVVGAEGNVRDALSALWGSIVARAEVHVGTP